MMYPWGPRLAKRQQHVHQYQKVHRETRLGGRTCSSCAGGLRAPDTTDAGVQELLPQGEPPALPGWLSEFDISGSMFFAVWAHIARGCAAALSCTMIGCEKAPLRGPQP